MEKLASSDKTTIVVMENEQIVNQEQNTQKQDYNDNCLGQIDWKGFRDSLWDEYRRERANKICNRCGHSVKYYLDQKRIEKRLTEEYENVERNRFYTIRYFIAKEDIESLNRVTNDSYHLCDKCIDHVRGITLFELNDNLRQVKDELEKRRILEIERRQAQDSEIKSLNKIVRIKKEKQAIQRNIEREKSLDRMVMAYNNNIRNKQARDPPYIPWKLREPPQSEPQSQSEITISDTELRTANRFTGWRNSLREEETQQ